MAHRFKVGDVVVIDYQHPRLDDRIGVVRGVGKCGDEYLIRPLSVASDGDPADANPIDLFDEEQLRRQLPIVKRKTFRDVHGPRQPDHAEHPRGPQGRRSDEAARNEMLESEGW